MTKLLALTLLSLSTFNVMATGLSDQTVSTIAEYHASNSRKVALYKIVNGHTLNHFKSVVELDCNNGKFADWRIKQYDENFIECEKNVYDKAFKEAGLNLTDKPSNISVPDFLKISIAKRNGIKTVKKYNTELIDIDSEDLTKEEIIALANELSRLVSRD